MSFSAGDFLRVISFSFSLNSLLRLQISKRVEASRGIPYRENGRKDYMIFVCGKAVYQAGKGVRRSLSYKRRILLYRG